VELKIERRAGNVIEAAAQGTTDGLALWLNVIAMLIAFMGLVALVDWILASISGNSVIALELSLARIFGWLFAPLAWLMGVNGWHDCQLFGSLLGTKVAVNEFVAYSRLHEMQASTQVALRFENVRSEILAAYALCGFANFSSIGIQIGGIGALVPHRRTELAQLGFKAMIGGALASWMTAAVAGVFV
jgi:CNT family concentrative nucleoside transporter